MHNNTVPLVFPNKDGHKLFGILHQPETLQWKKEGIIILSPGIKSRVAPHRLYVKMAKTFAKLGFPVLRFDFYGLGDSEGEITEKYAADFYGSVQVGRYINDTLCAMDLMEKEYNISRFILSGLCGGAITGLLTAAKDDRVKGLLGLSIPVILDSSNIVYDEFLTTTELKKKKQNYIKKLITIKAWKSWIRFLTLQSDYRLIFRSLFHKNKQQNNNEAKENNINPHFWPAFDRITISDRKILFIFAEHDRLYWQFKEKFLYINNINIDTYDNIEIKVIKKSNHIFSFKEWHDELVHDSSCWLGNYFN